MEKICGSRSLEKQFRASNHQKKSAAMVWATGARMWGALTNVMRKPDNESDIILDTVELLIHRKELTVLPRDDGMPVPNFL